MPPSLFVREETEKIVHPIQCQKRQQRRRLERGWGHLVNRTPEQVERKKLLKSRYPTTTNSLPPKYRLGHNDQVVESWVYVSPKTSHFSAATETTHWISRPPFYGAITESEEGTRKCIKNLKDLLQLAGKGIHERQLEAIAKISTTSNPNSHLPNPVPQSQTHTHTTPLPPHTPHPNLCQPREKRSPHLKPSR